MHGQVTKLVLIIAQKECFIDIFNKKCILMIYALIQIILILHCLLYIVIYWTAEDTLHKKYNSQFSLHLYKEIVYMCIDKIMVQRQFIVA